MPKQLHLLCQNPKCPSPEFVVYANVQVGKTGRRLYCSRRCAYDMNEKWIEGTSICKNPTCLVGVFKWRYRPCELKKLKTGQPQYCCKRCCLIHRNSLPIGAESFRNYRPVVKTDGGWRYKARLVAESMNKEPLRKGERVGFDDSNPLNCHPDNIVVLPPARPRIFDCEKCGCEVFRSEATHRLVKHKNLCQLCGIRKGNKNRRKLLRSEIVTVSSLLDRGMLPCEVSGMFPHISESSVRRIGHGECKARDDDD